MEKRVCANCGSSTTSLDKKGRKIWRIVNGQCWCHSCKMKKIFNPIFSKTEKVKATNKKWYDSIGRHRRFKFKDKNYTAGHFNVRKGICQWCGKKIGDKYIGYRGKERIITKTDIHHIEYHYSNKLKATVELCQSCHMLETQRIERIKRNIKNFFKNFIPLENKQIGKLCNNSAQMVDLLLENSG